VKLPSNYATMIKIHTPLSSINLIGIIENSLVIKNYYHASIDTNLGLRSLKQMIEDYFKLKDTILNNLLWIVEGDNCLYIAIYKNANTENIVKQFNILLDYLVFYKKIKKYEYRYKSNEAFNVVLFKGVKE